MTSPTIISNRKFHVAALGVAALALPFSITICHVGFLIFLILWGLEGGFIEKFTIVRKSTLLHLFLAFGAFLFIGIFYTENKTEGWPSLDKKIFLFAIPLALATSSIRFTKNEIRLLLYLFAATCFIGTLLCLANATLNTIHHYETNASFPVRYLNSTEFEKMNPTSGSYWLYFSYTALASGIAMHPAFLSLYLLFCVIFLLQELAEGNITSLSLKAAAAFLILYFSVFIICLASRVSILCLLCVFAFIASKNFSAKPKKKNSYAIAIFLSVCISMLWINPVSRYKNLHELFSTTLSVQENTLYQTSTEIRVSLLWIGWKSFLKVNPLIGAGMGDVRDVMKITSDEFEIKNAHQTNDPHNEYVALAIGAGFTGLVLFISCLGLPALMAFNVRDYFTFGFIFLFAALCLSEVVLDWQKSVAFFALFFPLLAFHRQAFQTNGIRLRLFNAPN